MLPGRFQYVTPPSRCCGAELEENIPIGRAATESFVFSQPRWGRDVVHDFTRGTERLDVRGSGAISFEQLIVLGAGGHSLAAAADGSTITLVNVATVTAADFLFG